MNGDIENQLPDLMSKIGSLDIVNPVICGSGEHVISSSGIKAALKAGAAVVIAKSVNEKTEANTQLSHAEYSIFDEAYNVVSNHDHSFDTLRNASILCRSGLQNSNKDWFENLAELDQLAAKTGRYVAGSIVMSNLSAAVEIAELANHCGLRILELNIGAPHSVEAKAGVIGGATDADHVGAIVTNVRKVFRGALWIKLTGLQTDVSALVVAAKHAGADAVCVSGRLMGFLPDVETLEPVLGTNGAYGGRWALPLTCRHLAMARRAVGKDFPMLGTNGARSGLDVARMLLAGASAVELSSIVYLTGFKGLTHVIEELAAWLSDAKHTPCSVVGLAADKIQSYAERTEKLNEWKKFVPEETLYG